MARKKKTPQHSKHIKAGSAILLGLLIAFVAGYIASGLQAREYFAPILKNHSQQNDLLQEYVKKEEAREQVYIDKNATIIPPEAAPEIEKNKQLALFNRAFKAELTTCGSDDTRTAADRVQEYERRLQINQYANRIVARSCNDFDNMYFLNRADQWEVSGVNIILDFKHNPKWLKTCYLDDLLPAANKKQPENSSIDAANREECEYIAKHRQNIPFEQLTFKYEKE